MKIELCGVGFSYPDRPVLKNVSLTLGSGDRIALMGRSGEGKTTLLRLLAGLERPGRGAVTGLPEQGVSMVFQENRLLPQLSALDNVALVAPQKSPEELRALLDALGMGAAAHLLPRELSGGMKRRVAIARAVAFGSPLLLLDEPFTGLDDVSRDAAASFLARAGAEILVAVTHDQKEAELLRARVVRLEELEA